ncbi:unnamed protein product [Rotaria socialis]|uniref:Helix-turn-helix domain-containing protein n=1 Tax=Rotaria socialis TaxID=392032 RepID=A0A821QRQ8_9BILA|nr:unnamed protein product [Rotaria socialis]CAF4829699.1 unnamed protein product [Rotaria socialis]
MPTREKIQLAYLYFIHKPHKAGTPLRLIVSSVNIPTTGISKFLYKLIQPIFDNYARSTTTINEVDLIQRLEANKIHGYVEDIFFTLNDSLESVDQTLDEANSFHPNIKLVRQISRSIPFLDLFIENSKGALKTSVHHKEAAEPYVVPFGSHNSGHVFRNTVDAAITRIVCYSTTLAQFEEKIRQMTLMFLYNEYPRRHNDRRLTTLFSKYLNKNFILSIVNNSDDFGYLRHQFLTTSTDTATKSITTDHQTHDKKNAKSVCTTCIQ